ncbi:MAG: redox-sensing transcriptional repressor Rex [Spirochaetota bacterium]
MVHHKRASLPTIKRLPSYLHIVEAALRDGKEYISGTVIADELELEPIQVRKDLATTGVVGTPRRGFPVRQLIDCINSFLRWNQETNAVLVGAGNLGTALIGYGEFRKHGLNIIAAFDPDKKKAGSVINGVQVYSLNQMRDRVQASGVQLAILTVPGEHAQAVCDLLVQSGINAIWNFTNIKLKVPEHVIVQKEDLSSGYAVLSVRVGLHNSQVV